MYKLPLTPLIFTLSDPIFPSAPCSWTLSAYVPPLTWETKFYIQILVLYFFIFAHFDSRWEYGLNMNKMSIFISMSQSVSHISVSPGSCLQYIRSLKYSIYFTLCLQENSHSDNIRQLDIAPFWASWFQYTALYIYIKSNLIFFSQIVLHASYSTYVFNMLIINFSSSY